MPKKSKKAGKHTTAPVEIYMVSRNGMWIVVKEQEFFLPFSEYPWFTKATIDQIYDVQIFHDHHLHWPALDVDLDIESFKSPEAYPLKFD